MRRFRNIFFALAAFLWLPASAHCQLESISGLEFFHCAVDSADVHSQAKDCSQCCEVEKSQYRTEHLRLSVLTPDLLRLLSAPVLLPFRPLSAEVRAGSLTAAPPQLRQTWQFVSRTALPARAPSLAS